MIFRQAICITTLVAFLPFAAGCSSRHTVRLNSDPGQSTQSVDSTETTRIGGYTTADSEFHKWNGEMRLVEPDSLEFRRVLHSSAERWSRGSDYPSHEIIRLGQNQVSSVQVVESEPVLTAFLVTGLLALASFGILLATFDPPFDN